MGREYKYNLEIFKDLLGLLCCKTPYLDPIHETPNPSHTRTHTKHIPEPYTNPLCALRSLKNILHFKQLQAAVGGLQKLGFQGFGAGNSRRRVQISGCMVSGLGLQDLRWRSGV